MKILITGASGLLGRFMYSECVKKSWDVTGTAFSRCNGFRKIDLTDNQQVLELFRNVQPSVVIHCAAERRPDVVEKDPLLAERVNVEAVQYVCNAAKLYNCKVLYISTDYVFDGTSPPYQTDSKPNPLNTYGRMKLLGERVTLDSSSKNIVLRVPILYGPVEYLGESAVTVLFDKVRDVTHQCLMSSYERRYPTHVQDVAAVCVALIEKSMEDNYEHVVNGVFHFSGPVMMTKYDMAITMAQIMGLPTDHILSEKGPAVGATTLRPYDTHLDCQRFMNIGILLTQTDFRSTIKACLEPFC